MSRLENNVIIITGASAGIGKELTLQLAPQKTRLVLAARSHEQLEKVAATCRELGAQTLCVQTDVANRAQCENLIEQTIKAFGRIDVLVNNAGMSMWAEFQTIQDISVFEKLMQVNYLGSVYPTFYALPHLLESKGRIVAVSSLTGKNGVPTRTGYAASKHALVGFFDSLRIELDDTGVSVTMIYPGFVKSQVRKRALGADGQPLGASKLDEEKIMPVDVCVRRMIRAIEKRDRELLMTTKAKIGLWLKLISPKLVDKIAKKSIQTGRT